jgi:hypothetical protein
MNPVEAEPETADYPAPEVCLNFQHSVRTATIRAISLIEETYGLNSNVRVLPVSGSCTAYCSNLKSRLNRDLISCMGQNIPSGVDEQEMLSFSASIASIPKSWPDSCDCMNGTLEEELISRLTKERQPVPDGYLDFCQEIILELFPKGLRQSRYDRHSARVTPPYSSTTEHSRSEGGSYSSWRNRRADYLSKERPEIVHEPSFMVANAPGKPRPLVKNHPTYLHLKPIHTMIYDKISTYPWLLRGPPSRRAFLGAGFTAGSKYLSADFVAATDNLRIEVAEKIFDSLIMVSSPSLVPTLCEARRSLRPTISFTKTTIVPTTGQLMGNLCSFPLLCLQNYIAARWVDKEMGQGETPKLINGDDLVAQVSKEWMETYKRLAPELGFQLNEKKSCYSRFLNVNSTYFTPNFKLLPFVRARGLSCRDPRNVGKVMSDIIRPFTSVRSSRTSRLVHCLSYHFRHLIRKSGLTLHSLNFRVRSEDCIWILRSLRRREKERSGWPMMPPKPLYQPMGMTLVQAEDPYGVHDNKEVAEAVISERWDMGEWKNPPKERLKHVIEDLQANKMRRRRGLGMRGTLRRLVREKNVVKKIWLPAAIADCYDLTHDTVKLVDLELVYSECPICERVREAIYDKRKEKERAEEASWNRLQFASLKEGIRIGAI